LLPKGEYSPCPNSCPKKQVCKCTPPVAVCGLYFGAHSEQMDTTVKTNSTKNPGNIMVDSKKRDTNGRNISNSTDSKRREANSSMGTWATGWCTGKEESPTAAGTSATAGLTGKAGTNSSTNLGKSRGDNKRIITNSSRNISNSRVDRKRRDE
jgi:hypothetical protein